MSVNAVILAGAPNLGKLKDCSYQRYEALVPIGGCPMIRHVVEAVAKATSIGKVCVVGPVAELERVIGDLDVVLADGGTTLVNSLESGLDAIGPGRRVFLSTGDVPLLTPEVVDAFISACGDMSADFYYPILTQQTLEAKFPGTKRTYVSLRDGRFTGGNVSLLNPEIVPACLERLSEFTAARKSPLKLARLLGVSFIIKFLLRTLTVAELETKISKMFGIVGRAVFCELAEVGIDVDKPVDLELVTAVLSNRACACEGKSHG